MHPPLNAYYFVFDTGAPEPGILVVVAATDAAAAAAARRHLTDALPEYRECALTLRELAPIAPADGTVVYVDEGPP